MPVERVAVYARPGSGLYASIVGVFVGLLLISNVGAVKLIEFGPIITDGGAFLFPLVYITGGIITEIYGLKAARRAIYLGFVMGGLAALTFWIVQMSPPAADWPNQQAFEAVLGFVPRIVLASLVAYLVGELINAYVIVRIKRRTAEKKLWLRLLGSSVVGQLFDTIVFCTIAFYGVITGGEFLTYVIFGYVYKVTVEFVLFPATFAIVRALKRHEPTYGEISETRA